MIYIQYVRWSSDFAGNGELSLKEQACNGSLFHGPNHEVMFFTCHIGLAGKTRKTTIYRWYFPSFKRLFSPGIFQPCLITKEYFNMAKLRQFAFHLDDCIVYFDMSRCQTSLSSLSSRKKGIAFLGGPIAIHGFAKKIKGRGREKEKERKARGKGTEEERKRKEKGKEKERKRKRNRRGKEEEGKRKGRGKEKERKRKGRGKKEKRKSKEQEAASLIPNKERKRKGQRKGKEKAKERKRKGKGKEKERKRSKGVKE